MKTKARRACHNTTQLPVHPNVYVPTQTAITRSQFSQSAPSSPKHPKHYTL